SRPAMDGVRWESLLSDWATAANVNLPESRCLRAASVRLSETFGRSWREALKRDYERGGRAWAATQLDILSEILQQSAEPSTFNSDLILAVAGLSQQIRTLDDFTRQVRNDDSLYASEVISRLDTLRRRLEDFSRQLTDVSADTEEIGHVL